MHSRRLKEDPHMVEEGKQKDRILYIVTSMAEFDNGRRATVKGYDRFSNTIVPVIRESVTSMIGTGYDVDLYLITHYSLSMARYNEVLAALPDDTVGFQVWDEATPLGYEREHSVDVIKDHFRGLSRQHRYVIKDKFFHYDLFVCFEDDMLIRGPHVQHYVQVTNSLYHLRTHAADKLPEPPPSSSSSVMTVEQAADLFYGPMTRQQLARTIPGFMRVEAALPNFRPGPKENRFDQIPTNYQWGDDDNDSVHSGIDPSICCHVSALSTNPHIPLAPDKDDLYFWETSLDALGVRQMPKAKIPSSNSSSSNNNLLELDWVLTQGGNSNALWWDPAYVVGDFWSGRGEARYFGNRTRPERNRPRYMNNQGGWMATRRQLVEWHGDWCRGGFLP